jgi:hypothetical protein
LQQLGMARDVRSERHHTATVRRFSRFRFRFDFPLSLHSGT